MVLNTRTVAPSPATSSALLRNTREDALDTLVGEPIDDEEFARSFGFVSLARSTVCRVLECATRFDSADWTAISAKLGVADLSPEVCKRIVIAAKGLQGQRGTSNNDAGEGRKRRKLVFDYGGHDHSAEEGSAAQGAADATDESPQDAEADEPEDDVLARMPKNLTERQQLAWVLQQTATATERKEKTRQSEHAASPSKAAEKDAPDLNQAEAAPPKAVGRSKTPEQQCSKESTQEQETAEVSRASRPKTVAPVPQKHKSRRRPKDFDAWSEAKQRAWNEIDSNPNAFYYRHLPPGEKQRTGKWATDEHSAFMKALQKRNWRPDGHWGLFAMEIPGRVGYQCRNYYHFLLSRNDLQDPDYMDENGEYTPKKVRRSSSAPSSPVRAPTPKSSTKQSTKSSASSATPTTPLSKTAEPFATKRKRSSSPGGKRATARSAGNAKSPAERSDASSAAPPKRDAQSAAKQPPTSSKRASEPAGEVPALAPAAEPVAAATSAATAAKSAATTAQPERKPPAPLFEVAEQRAAAQEDQSTAVAATSENVAARPASPAHEVPEERKRDERDGAQPPQAAKEVAEDSASPPPGQVLQKRRIGAKRVAQAQEEVAANGGDSGSADAANSARSGATVLDSSAAVVVAKKRRRDAGSLPAPTDAEEDLAARAILSFHVEESVQPPKRRMLQRHAGVPAQRRSAAPRRVPEALLTVRQVHSSALREGEGSERSGTESQSAQLQAMDARFVAQQARLSQTMQSEFAAAASGANNHLESSRRAFTLGCSYLRESAAWWKNPSKAERVRVQRAPASRAQLRKLGEQFTSVMDAVVRQQQLEADAISSLERWRSADSASTPTSDSPRETGGEARVQRAFQIEQADA